MPKSDFRHQFLRKFSILHISDLHKDINDEVDNAILLDSLERDFSQYLLSSPRIEKPSLCIVSGDLVYGVKSPKGTPKVGEIERQYSEVEALLVGLADKFFDGDRERVIILPGNHDVCYDDFLLCLENVGLPTDEGTRKSLVKEFFTPRTQLRWSWDTLGFYRINDSTIYNNRFRHFAYMYRRFYQDRRMFPTLPEEQHGIFDFQNLGISILALNSCYNNDPMRRSGAFHPKSIAAISSAIRERKRAGWVIIAAWHHNLSGGPNQDDYLDTEVIQLLIDAGVSVGLHGHQHLPECVDERYRVGPSNRKMTIVSAGTLCAGPKHLSPGVPRSFNVVEFDIPGLKGRVHKREMANKNFAFPIWGPGHFSSTNSSYLDFELCAPLQPRPAGMDIQLILETSEKLVGSGQYKEAVSVLENIRDVELARPLLLKSLSAIEDNAKTIELLWPPQTIAEAITIGGALIYDGSKTKVEEFLKLELISNSTDASVSEIRRRIRERWKL